MVVKVAVVGGGINGLGCAYCLSQRFPNLDLTLISDKFSPETTGDGAAGLWTPYLVQDTPRDLVKKWSLATFDFFLKLWKTEHGGAVGISLIPAFIVGSENLVPPEGALGLHELSPAELKRLLNLPGIQKGFRYTSFTCEPAKILPYFLEEFVKSGGKVVRSRVKDLESVAKDFDIVVHCTGLGASNLVATDESIRPIRGQVHRVKAPNIFHVLMNNNNGGYIIPNQDTIVLGGTHQENNWNMNNDEADKAHILSRCIEMVPSLKNAVLARDWVGLRPARKTVRLESEKIEKNGKLSVIIHNYGHGGAGITLFWGCALQVADFVQEAIQDIQNTKLKANLSKL